jgi:hypothetical protein
MEITVNLPIKDWYACLLPAAPCQRPRASSPGAYGLYTGHQPCSMHPADGRSRRSHDRRSHDGHDHQASYELAAAVLQVPTDARQRPEALGPRLPAAVCLPGEPLLPSMATSWTEPDTGPREHTDKHTSMHVAPVPPAGDAPRRSHA